MICNIRLHNVAVSMLFTAAVLSAPIATAQIVPLPGSADSSRIEGNALIKPPAAEPAQALPTPNAQPPSTAPEGSENIRFIAKKITLSGLTTFDKDMFAPITQPYINKEMSIADLFGIAEQITLHYRKAGYLLSYAFIPDQRIADGFVTIQIVEGFIENVVIEGDDPNSFISHQYAQQISSQKPLKEKTLESSLLRLNDLPGRTYRAVLSKEPGQAINASTLTLLAHKKPLFARIGYDNFSSRYLGPNELNATVSQSVLPLQNTTISLLNSLPLDRLNYAQVSHAIAVAKGLNIELSGSYAESAPEFRLAPLEIKSTTLSFDVGANYQAIRQRDENLSLSLRGGSRHATGKIFNDTLLTRDEIRTIKAGASYDMRDRFKGSNTINFEVTKGVSWFGASDARELTLSRAEATSNFTKAELSLSRLQSLSSEWSALFQTSGQIASEPLYASEEFGVGGQMFGRAYDASEIVGDNGLSGALEIRYHGLTNLQPINLEPFVFIDSGFVSNIDAGQEGFETLSSVGGGMRFAIETKQSGMIGFAFPLSRNPDAPIFGSGNSGPRILLQLSHQF